MERFDGDIRASDDSEGDSIRGKMPRAGRILREETVERFNGDIRGSDDSEGDSIRGML